MSIDPEVKRTLDMRLVNGEISHEEYTKMLDSLRAMSEKMQVQPKPEPVTVNARPQPPAPPATPSNGPGHYASGNQTIHVNVPQQESVVFAVITLLCWIFVAPVGLILNIIGLITGPKRGCFFAMFMLFVLVPVIIVLVMLAAGVPIFEELERVLNGY